MKNFSNMNDVVDASDEDFTDFCSNQNLGYILSLKNQLIPSYELMRSTKDALVKKALSETNPNLKQSINETINGAYYVLLSIERKVSICNNFIKSLGNPESTI